LTLIATQKKDKDKDIWEGKVKDLISLIVHQKLIVYLLERNIGLFKDLQETPNLFPIKELANRKITYIT